MEADWEIEIGPDDSGGEAPVIDAHWTGFVDLRQEPARIKEISECAEFAALGDTLLKLNGAQTSVWSSKCDLWVVEDFAQFDRDEFDATEDDGHAVACYIDILPREENAWEKAEDAIRFCSEIVEQLKIVPIKAARTELILRQAVLSGDRQETGITAYVTGCGENPAAARARLTDALVALAETLAAHL